MAEIRPNKVKQKLANGDAATIIMGNLNSDLMDAFGPLGFDGAWIEGEHGPVDFKDIPDMTRACDLWGMTSVARVNMNEPGVIYRTLDVGAQGVVVPHVNTAEEARAVVKASKFHPLGERGSFTSRQGYGVDDYVNKANDHTLVIVLIEDVIALENLSEIVKVDHIDVFFVAPGDLAQTMGMPGGAAKPPVVEAVTGAVKAITEAGRVAGMISNDDDVEYWVEAGVRCLTTKWEPWVERGAARYLDVVASASR